MKKKILGIIVDIILITLIFSITDMVMLKVLRSENLWLELGVYLVLYALMFGIKSLIVNLWKRSVSKKAESKQRDE